MRHPFLTLAAGLFALALLSLPAIAHALLSLTSGGGFLFDVYETYGGYLSNGTTDAYDGAYYLEVNGTTLSTTTGTTSTDGRTVTIAATTLGAVSVQRFIYVPASGGDYARFLDVVSNPGSTAAAARIVVRGNLGSDSSTVLYATSSGDAALTTGDTWFGTDDTDGTLDPSLAHVFQGTSPRVGATAATLTSDNFSWEFSTSIPPGARVAVLTFAIQKNNRADAEAEARRLVELPDDAIVGLDDYLDEIINFSIAAPGAPRVRFMGPYDADEGDEVPVTITVEDPEGDTATWSWDTDDDGVFGEMAGATSYTVPAGTTDGDGTVRVGVSATDGTNTTERYRTIQVRNVEPLITSSPPSTTTSVGASYRYPIEVEDPGGALDPLVFSVTRGPTGAVVADTGMLTWTPNERDVTLSGETITIEIQVSDGDGGTATQSWEMSVSPNRAPTQPVPIFPISGIGLLDPGPRLVAGNATDPDHDALTYFFQVDTVPTFDSADLQESGAVTETPGYSFWYVPSPLRPGRYHWRVWVSDAAVETEPRAESFFVVPDPDAPPDAGPPEADGGTVGDPDAGPPGRRDSGGCAVGGADDPAWAWALVLVVLAARWRRRARPRARARERGKL